MARALAVSMICVRLPRKRKNNPWQQVDSLPDGAGDLLDVIKSALDAVEDDDLVDEQKQKYVRIEEVALASGRPRILVATLEVGNYGEVRRTLNVATHQETHQLGKDEAAVSRLRVVFVVPKGSRMALMFSERAALYSATSAVQGVLKRYWKDQTWGSAWHLSIETVVNVEAWLQSAQVSKVEVTSYGHTTDYEGISQTGRPLGDLTITLAPPKGQGHLAKRLWTALKDHPAERAKILGIEGMTDDLDEVRVTVEGETGQRKTFFIDRQNTPILRIPLGDAEGDPSRPNHLVSRCIAEAPGIYADVGMEWHSV